LHARLRALRRRHDDVRGLFLVVARFGHDHRFDAEILRIVGHHDLGHQDPARRRHEAGGEEIGQQLLADHARIGAEDRACDARHADRHDR
jgi:hypothetical protein